MKIVAIIGLLFCFYCLRQACLASEPRAALDGGECEKPP
jgi:hypothetical protein